MEFIFKYSDLRALEQGTTTATWLYIFIYLVIGNTCINNKDS